MSDLPTRDQAKEVLLLRRISPDERALAWPVIRSYVDGVLKTREEFIASLDPILIAGEIEDWYHRVITSDAADEDEGACSIEEFRNGAYLVIEAIEATLKEGPT